MNNICDICGYSFARTGTNQKRHKGECTRIAFNNKKYWLKPNNILRKKSNRKRISYLEKMRMRLKTGYDPIKKCVICQKMFERRVPNSLTCSIECRNKNKSNVKKLKSVTHLGDKVKCSICDHIFIRIHSNSKRCQKCLKVPYISDSYIAVTLRSPIRNVPVPLIAAKRAQLQLMRLVKQIKTQKTK
jgi:hypothetical protein